jgi:hypothetical protein
MTSNNKNNIIHDHLLHNPAAAAAAAIMTTESFTKTETNKTGYVFEICTFFLYLSLLKVFLTSCKINNLNKRVKKNNIKKIKKLQ